MSMTKEELNNRIEELMKEGTPKGLMAIPKLLGICNVPRRPGFSPMRAAAAVIQALAKVGYNPGKNPDGSDNIMNYFIYSMFKEGHSENMKNGVVDIPVAPNSLSVLVSGANAGGPFTATGGNIVPFLIKGMPR